MPVYIAVVLVLCANSAVALSVTRQQSGHKAPQRPFVAESRSASQLFASLMDNGEKTENKNGQKIEVVNGDVRPGSLLAATIEQGRVPYGESSRQYRRTEFTHEDWLQHRSSGRSVTNLKGIFFSGIVRQLQTEVKLVSLVALAIVVWNGVLVPSEASGGLLPYISLPSLPFTLSSPALGLLLVFRTNSSYGRWLDARTTWGKIITQSRNVVRMAATFCDGTTPEGRQSLEQLTRATWAFSRSLMNQLSGPEDEAPYEEELRQVFPTNNDPASFVPNILASPDRSTAALMELSMVLDNVPIDEKRRVEIDKSLVLIGDCVGTCERIYSSPVPLVYTRHTARFLTMWMLLVPASLYNTFASVQSGTNGVDTAPWLQVHGLAMIPAVALMALFLFGIEELAVQLEEPFGILPMQKFCDGILESGNSMLEWNQIRSSRHEAVE